MIYLYEEGKRNWFAIFPALESGNSVWYEPSEEKNNWFATFTNLPVTDSSGKEMTYTVSEDKVTDYTTRMLVGNMDTLNSIKTALKQKVKAATNDSVNLTDDQTDLALSTVLTMDLTSSTSSNVDQIIAMGKEMKLTLDATSATALLKELKNVDLSALNNSEASVKAVPGDKTEVLVLNIYNPADALNLNGGNNNNTNGSGKTGSDSDTDGNTNSNANNTKTVTTTATTSKLPETGMLWWPVPVFASLGILFFLTGLWLRRRREKDPNVEEG